MDRELAIEAIRQNLPTYLSYKGVDINRKFRCLCPEHLDNNPSMMYSKRRNKCHCFACGADADTFKLLQWDYGVDSFQEAFEIGCQLFGLDLETRERKTKLKPVKKKTVKRTSQKTPKKADVEVCDKVYNAMSKVMPLTEEDVRYLKVVRHLEETRIRADYFRMSPKNRDAVIRKVKKLTGFTDDVLKLVPGFYINKGKMDFYADDGIGILLRNVDGKIHAVQIRRDTSEKGRRYTWFSSSFSDTGTSPGAAKDVLIPKKPKPCLCITEGRFKAEILASQGNVVISVQGVSTWRGIEKIIEKLNVPLKTICLMFDADVMGNIQLLKTLRDMSQKLKKEFPDRRLIAGVWKESMGKGIDDCYFNGNIKKVKYVDAVVFFQKMLDTVDELQKEKGITSLHNLQPENQKRFKTYLQKRNEEMFFPSAV